MRLRGRLQPQAALEQPDRGVAVAELMLDDREMVQSERLVAVGGKNLLVGGARLGELPGLEQPDRRCQLLLQARRRSAARAHCPWCLHRSPSDHSPS